MAGGQERRLRRRIRSVQSTRKITRAMELIAASRIVRAQQAIAAARPYVARMHQVVRDLADTPDARRHPLFREVEQVRRAAVIVVAGDRGLAGAYNTSVLRMADRLMHDHEAAGRQVTLVAFGRKTYQYFRYRGRPMAAHFIGSSERPTFEDARQVVATVMGPFAAGELDSIELVYTRFLSMGSQSVTTRQLIPLTALDEPADAGERRPASYEFEPDPADILDRLLPNWLEAEVLAALLDAAASEQAARQRAMKAATDNADDLVKTLTRIMNRARQDAITTEIMEIVGGAEALRSARASSAQSA
ncbi:MAG TPA: F0F1 ATP synthase subunit gamma [Acidimicrobiales bacterium]|nr:F0F1 ATP synthase subunit gamma [Acidimicrobiales bacterium]